MAVFDDPNVVTTRLVGTVAGLDLLESDHGVYVTAPGAAVGGKTKPVGGAIGPNRDGMWVAWRRGQEPVLVAGRDAALDHISAPAVVAR